MIRYVVKANSPRNTGGNSPDADKTGDSDMTKSEKENLPDVNISIRRLTKDKFPYVPLLTSLTDYKSQGQTFFEPC